MADIATAWTCGELALRQVQEPRTRFFDGLTTCTSEAQSRCRHKLQALAEALTITSPEAHQLAPHVDPMGASV